MSGNGTNTSQTQDNKPAGNAGGGAAGSQPPKNEQREHSEPRINLSPFIVECGDHKNSGLFLVDTLKLKLRGRADRANWRGHGGYTSQMPDIPGMRLEVHPRDQIVIEFDPLEQDKPLRDKIETIYQNAEVTIRPVGGEKVNPWPRIEHKLNIHQMKSLLLEIARKVHVENVEARSFIVVRGKVPTLDELAQQPGKELYDHWSINERRPRFVEDADAWINKLENSREHVG
jgi:hypothetical protein